MSDPIHCLFGLAESCVFGKQSLGPFLCGLRQLGLCILTYLEATLLPKLRDHFAEFLREDSLEHLRILTPPTCVRLRYGHLKNSLRGFSRQHAWDQFVAKRPPHHLSELTTPRVFLGDPPTGLGRDNQRPADLVLLRYPIVSLSPLGWYGNVRPLSITYAFRPRLRVRLTLSGLTLLRKPWVFGGRVSRPSSRYLCRHDHFRFVHRLLSRRLQPTTERSPTTPGPNRPGIRSFGIRLESRELSAQDHSTSELLRTL